ncbi:MAG: hypothetical protein JWQ44_2115 [Chthoniobacter sp.]|nr:hypothetical protein [Chthoniobacter sp.]
MDPFTPGLRELSRKFGRLRHRLRRGFVRRDLIRAETDLGLLGWQQAEFDPQTQAQVEKITTYEREQSRLTNESAGLGKELRELREQKEAGRRAFEEERRRIENERRAIVSTHPQIERQLAAKRKTEPALERRMPELERELRDINRLYSELLSHPEQTAPIKQELFRLRERIVSIPNEKSDLRNQHLRTVSEIRSLEAQLERDRLAIEQFDRQSRELQASFDEADNRLGSEIRTRDREKVRLEKEINLLESAKHNPYLQIGRVLADNGIAPMNQPAALDRVKRLRLKVAELEYLVTLSRKASSLDDQQAVVLSWMVWGVMFIIGLLVVLAVLPGG